VLSKALRFRREEAERAALTALVWSEHDPEDAQNTDP
jgi:hypothetical protein